MEAWSRDPLKLALELGLPTWCEDILVSTVARALVSGFNDFLAADDDQADPDITPKAAKQATRTASAGAFLKSEFHRRSIDIEAGRLSVRGKQSLLLWDQATQKAHPSSPAKNRSPKIPERRPSKSKNFFLRAIAGRSADETKPSMRRSDSTLSRNTLIRRLSRSKNRDGSSSGQYYEASINSIGTAESSEPKSFDIADVDITTRLSSYDTSPSVSLVSRDTSAHANSEVFVLCPQISITPEICSADSSACSFWVAIKITGVLQSADDHGSRKNAAGRFSSEFVNTRQSGKLRPIFIPDLSSYTYIQITEHTVAYTRCESTFILVETAWSPKLLAIFMNRNSLE